MTKRAFRALPLILCLAILAAACGSDSNSGTAKKATGPAAAGVNDKATVAGAGSTFVATMLQEWIKQYKTVAPGVSINYQSVGSGAGVQQLTAKTVDFAGSDGALKPQEQAATGGPGAVLQIPWIAGGVAVEYNLPGVKDLKLSAPTVAGIFMGKITKWDDAAIKGDNGGTAPSSLGIQVAHRSDGSGTTQVFTEFLKAAAPDAWTIGSGKDVPWTTGTGAKGSDGVTANVKQVPGAIGYAEVSYPMQASLGTALIKNTAGQFVGPTAKGVTAAIAKAQVNPDLTLKLSYTTDDPAAYPISTTTYLMFYRDIPDQAKAVALKHFATWALTDGQKLAEGLNYAPMPDQITRQAQAVLGA
jgi:phosphate transport system substrate-binding protein